MIPSKVNLIQYNPIENSSMNKLLRNQLIYNGALSDAKLRLLIGVLEDRY